MSEGVSVGFPAIGSVANAPPCLIEKYSRHRNLSSGTHALSSVEQPLHPSVHHLLSELNRIRPHSRESLIAIQCATKGDNGF